MSAHIVSYSLGNNTEHSPYKVKSIYTEAISSIQDSSFLSKLAYFSYGFFAMIATEKLKISGYLIDVIQKGMAIYICTNIRH